MNHPARLLGLPAVIDQRARDALRRAQELAWCHGYVIETRMRRGRSVARVIVLQAHCVEADAILLGLASPRFSWLAPRLSRTARDVLREAPCPVLLEHYPDGDTLRASEAVAEAERVLLAAGRPVIVLRPHVVYGPGDTTLLPRLLAAERFGRLVAGPTG